MRRGGWWLLWLGLAVAGCTRPAEDRAVKDLEVGRSHGAGVTLNVEDGLATVRGVSDGTVTLWAQAPAFRVRATAAQGSPLTWTLVVRNAMPEARLVAERAGGGVLEVVPQESLRPTVRVWTVELPPGAEAVLSVAPEDWDVARPFRFAALADVQEALPEVGDIFERVNQDPTLQFIFFSGDLTERGDREALLEFQERLESTSRIPLFATLGNHETYTTESPLPYHVLVGRGTMHFTFAGAHFTMLDSGNGTLDPLAEAQLDGWLAAARDSVHVVGSHMPLIDPVGLRGAGFNSRAEAGALMSKLAREGVDLTLYGHVHSYYAFSNAGIPAYISGGGGAIPERWDGIGRHYLAVDVDPAVGVREVAVVRVD
ncbi:metallophosphoesterase [Myxococcaceae bacterium GXIMD 01537]